MSLTGAGMLSFVDVAQIALFFRRLFRDRVLQTKKRTVPTKNTQDITIPAIAPPVIADDVAALF